MKHQITFYRLLPPFKVVTICTRNYNSTVRFANKIKKKYNWIIYTKIKRI